MDNSNMENATDTFDISRLQALAETGDTDAQYRLGLCYKFGLNVDKDAAQAAYYSYDGQMLWGEMGPDTIPCVEQMPVVLICPEKFPRSWDLFFAVSCNPYLKPLAEIKRELSKEEVREWMGKIQGTR